MNRYKFLVVNLSVRRIIFIGFGVDRLIGDCCLSSSYGSSWFRRLLLISTVSFFLYHVAVTVFCPIFLFLVCVCVCVCVCFFCLACECDMKMYSRKGIGPHLVTHYGYLTFSRDAELQYILLFHYTPKQSSSSSSSSCMSHSWATC